MKFIHDTDGKIYLEEEGRAVFLFEVLIRDGDCVASRLNAIVNTKQNSALDWLFEAVMDKTNATIAREIRNEMEKRLNNE
jgi:hypothetical protein